MLSPAKQARAGRQRIGRRVNVRGITKKDQVGRHATGSYDSVLASRAVEISVTRN
jgi:hypothetical protein